MAARSGSIVAPYPFVVIEPLPRVCVPECPVDAIQPDTDPGLEKWLSLNAEYAKIWPNITVKKALPPDSKEWEGKPDKLRYFSPNPGAGD